MIEMNEYATPKESGMPKSDLSESIFDRPDPVNPGGLFDATASRRMGYLRSIAEDVEMDFRMAEDTRTRHGRERLFEAERAALRAPERHALVDQTERAAVRHSALLFAQVVRFAREDVLAEEVAKVLTTAEVESLLSALKREAE